MDPLVLKIGGTLIDDQHALHYFFDCLQQNWQLTGRPLVIVHGGGVLVDDLINRLGLVVNKHQGLRVTPTDQIDIVAGALAGTANKKLLACAKYFKLPAIGLCASDGDMLQVIKINELLGHVGTVNPFKQELINLLLGENYLPIISSIGISDEGQIMNINADHVAVALAKMLHADLAMLVDVPGVLDRQGSVIQHLDTFCINNLTQQGVIQGGMAIKVQAALDAAQQLGKVVSIASWRSAQQLNSLLQQGGAGTAILP